MKLKPYPKYKDSGVEWLGEVPEGWEVTKLKHRSKFSTGWTPPTGDDSAYIGDNLWANISDLGSRIIYDTSKRISDAAVAKANIPITPKGSLLFSFKLSIGQVSFAGADMYTNEAIASFSPGQGVNVSYAYYAFPLFLVQNAEENIYGAKLLNQDLIKNAEIAVPGLPEQTTIASFLDRETTKLDTLIAKQEKLIELLKEKRQAVISHAVTEGLDPDVPMKDSGVEWLGMVPAEWDFVRLGFLFDNKKRPLMAGYGVVTAFRDGQVTLRTNRRIDGFTEADKEIGYQGVKPGDLVIHAMDAFAGAIGVSDSEGKMSPVCSVCEPKPGVISRYYGYLMRNIALTGYITSLAKGIRERSTDFRWADARLIPVPVPKNQQQIVTFLDSETAKLDLLIEKAQRSIELAKEHRTALISAAVTGKIDVSNKVPELSYA